MIPKAFVPLRLFGRRRDRAAPKGARPDNFPIIARPAREPDRQGAAYQFGDEPPAPVADALLGARGTAVPDGLAQAFNAFARLSGRADLAPDGTAGFDDARLHAASAWLREGPCRLEDGWYPDTHADTANDTVRLRLRLSAAPTGSAPVLSAYQADPQHPDETGAPSLLRVGRAAIAPTLDFVDLSLASPLMPILLILEPAIGGEGAEAEARAALLPFPSLLRGGLHYAELAASLPHGTTIAEAFAFWRRAVAALLTTPAAPFAVGRVAGADGAPLMGAVPAAQPIADWLATVFGLTADGRAAIAGSGRQSGSVLLLPPDALPTLAALVALEADAPTQNGACVGPYLVVDPVSSMPRHEVSLPATISALADFQPRSAPALPLLAASPDATTVRASVPFPLALCLRAADAGAPGTETPAAHAPLLRRTLDPATIAPGDVVALVLAHDADRTAALLEDLAAQSLADRLTVRLSPVEPDALGGPVPAVAARFGERCTMVAATASAMDAQLAAARAAGGRAVLLVSDTVRLPDPATLETLLVLTGEPDVASASPLLIHQQIGADGTRVTFSNGGWVPVRVSLQSAPTIVLGQPDWTGALPNATWPVLATGPEIALFRAEALALLDHMPPDPRGLAALLRLALANSEAGRTHLVTSAVQATSLAEPGGRDIPDPTGPGSLTPDRLGALLSAATMVREIKG